MKPHEQYTVNEVGTITDPGKFEGECLYTPYFWDQYMNGWADTDDGEVLGFKVQPEDIKLFPALAGTNWVFLLETEQGVIEVSDGPTA